MMRVSPAQVSLAAEDIRNEKVKVLKCMKAMSMDDVVLGQYRSRSLGGKNHPGYLDDKTVPPDRSAPPPAHRRPGWLGEFGPGVQNQA